MVAVTGAARISPTAPKSAPPAMVTIRTASGWMPSAAAHRERLHELLEHAVGQQLDDDHARGGIGSRPSERDQDGEDPGRPGAEYGM